MRITDLVRSGDLDAIKKLTANGGPKAVLAARDLTANTILHIACQKGIAALFDYALEIGVDINAMNAAGDTALVLAAKRGDIKQIKQLVEAKAEVARANDHGNTPLHYAAFWRHEEAAMYLATTAGIHVNTQNIHGKTPLEKTSDAILQKLTAISKTQGDHIIKAEVRSKTEASRDAIDLLHAQAPIDWDIPASSIQIMNIISQSRVAIVYKGVWNNHTVAVRVPVLPNEVTEEDVRVVIAEISAIRKLNHPALASIITSCITPPDISYITEYSDYGNLSTLLHNPQIEMTPSHAMKIAFDTAKAMVYLHEQRTPVVHRRIKSANILVYAEGNIRIVDYGFTRSIFNPRQVFPDTLFDTEWLAPEILAGKETPDARPADVYSFGVLLYEIVTRQYPYDTHNAMAIGLQVAVEGKRPEIPPYVPMSLRQIMEQCWCADPSKRPTFKMVQTMLIAVRL